MLLHARAVLVQHAKIVIGELQVIFGVDAIPLHLRVTREILVFLVELIRIAPRPVVDAISPLRVALRAPTATAPTAARLPIVHQPLIVLVATALTRAGALYGCAFHSSFAPANSSQPHTHITRPSTSSIDNNQ